MRVTALTLSALCALTLAGCSNVAADQPPPSTTTSGGAATSAAAATSSAPTGPFTIVGVMTLVDSYTAGSGGIGCQGSGGYSDMRPGAVATASDAAGTIVAVGSIKVGGETEKGCQLFFEIPDVPQSAFYQIEVSNRGLVTFTEEEARGGEVMLSLGG